MSHDHLIHDDTSDSEAIVLGLPLAQPRHPYAGSSHAAMGEEIARLRDVVRQLVRAIDRLVDECVNYRQVPGGAAMIVEARAALERAKELV